MNDRTYVTLKLCALQNYTGIHELKVSFSAAFSWDKDRLRAAIKRIRQNRPLLPLLYVVVIVLHKLVSDIQKQDLILVLGRPKSGPSSNMSVYVFCVRPT